MFFKSEKKPENKLEGLYASIEDLIEQKKYISYIKNSKNKITSDNAGEVRSAFKGRGMELEEVRAYGFGDDIRDIDWRVTARKDETYTKVFAEEKDREVYTLIDLSPFMLFGTKKQLKSVCACKIASMLGWQSMANKDRFGVLLYDGIVTKFFKAQNNQKNLMAILKNISNKSLEVLGNIKKEQDFKPDLYDSLKYLQYNLKNRATVFVISDFNNISDLALKSLVALTKKCRVYCINIYDVVEEVSPKYGEYMAEYNGQKLVFNTNSADYNKIYFEYFYQKRKKMEDFCKKFGCYYQNIRTDIPLYKQLKVI